jgi:hypothetical protein
MSSELDHRIMLRASAQKHGEPATFSTKTDHLPNSPHVVSLRLKRKSWRRTLLSHVNWSDWRFMASDLSRSACIWTRPMAVFSCYWSMASVVKICDGQNHMDTQNQTSDQVVRIAHLHLSLSKAIVATNRPDLCARLTRSGHHSYSLSVAFWIAIITLASLLAL